MFTEIFFIAINLIPMIGVSIVVDAKARPAERMGSGIIALITALNIIYFIIQIIR